MSSKLVAYFSATGVTGEVAKTLAESIGADLFEIKPKTPYTQADLNWMDQNARSTIEMSDPASRPEKVEGCKMHTNAKRLFSLLLAALLVASLCACGQQSFDRTEGIEPPLSLTKAGKRPFTATAITWTQAIASPATATGIFPCAARSSPSRWGRERSCNS